MNRHAGCGLALFGKAYAGAEAGQMYDVSKDFPAQRRLTYTENVRFRLLIITPRGRQDCH